MGISNFPGGADPSETLSYIANSGGVFSDSVTLPSNRRQAMDGSRPIWVYRVRVHGSGRGGSRSLRVGIANGRSNYITVGSAGSAQNTGWIGIGLASYGGNFRVLIEANGSFYFGRASSGGATTIVGNSSPSWDGSIAGICEWCESPTAPRSASATLISTTTARISWAAPSDNGGAAISNYRIYRSTSPSMSNSSQVTVGGSVTSYDWGGLAAGETYYFLVRAMNLATNGVGLASVGSAVVSAQTGTVPGAPTTVAADAGPGYFGLTWQPPASDGGVAISGYKVDIASDSGFGTILDTASLGSGARDYTYAGPTPGATVYGRVRAVNSIGEGANAAAVNAAVPARTALDIVHAASVMVSGGVQVSLVSSGAASNPTFTLVARAFPGSAGVTISTPTGFFTPGGPRNFDLVADAAGNLYLIGVPNDERSSIAVAYYPRTGTATWGAATVKRQALASTGNPIVGVAAAYVPGTGSTPQPSIVVIARRSGTVGAGAVSFALVNPAAVAGSGDLFRSSGSDPSWLSTPPTSAAPNSGTLDITPLVAGSRRLAASVNGYAVIEVTNGVVTSLAKSANGQATTGPYTRVVGIDSSTFALFRLSGSDLAWWIINTSGSTLSNGTIAGSNVITGAFALAWDAFYDSVARVVKVYTIADDNGAKVEAFTISPVTYAVVGPTTRVAAIGSASNRELRTPHGIVDERRIVVEVANGTATAVAADTWGNVAPTSPAVTDVVGIDGSNPNTFAWAFGDPNPADTQSAFQVQVQRVADSVTVHDTGKVASTASSRTIAAGVIANGQDYRWHVRTYDALDVVSDWSAWDSFTAAALGTLTITYPATDNPAGLDTASVTVVWSYVQGDGYVQTQRRVRVIRTADSAVLSDTGMQANTASSHTVTNLPNDTEVRIEVSLVTNAPGSPTVGPSSRKVTASYGTPMPPAVELEVGESYIAVVVTNPEPSGDRPEVVRNIIERRLADPDLDFVAIGSTAYNGTFFDYSVASGREYDYRVKGLTE